MSKCVLCKKVIENEDPAMLCVSGSGMPCLICDTCEEAFNTVLDSEDKGEIRQALEHITSQFNGTHSTIVIEAVNEILSEASALAREVSKELKAELESAEKDKE